MINIQFLIIIIFIWLSSLQAVSAKVLDKSYIEDFAKSYVEKNTAIPSKGTIEVTVSKLDPRIVIKPCLSPLAANIPENHQGRNVNVKISCADTESWQLYLNAKVKTMIPVLIANAGISKGSILSSDNVNIEYKDQGSIRGEIINTSNGIIGAKAKRTISKGTAITKRNICLVCKGENVTIIAKSSSFTIKTAGIALSSGSMGDQVSIKNPSSGRIVSAQVKAINKVIITL